jgi:hypothetical protein
MKLSNSRYLLMGAVASIDQKLGVQLADFTVIPLVAVEYSVVEVN